MASAPSSCARARPESLRRGGDDAGGSEQPGDLYGEQADGPAGPEHEHGLALLQLATPIECQPGRHASDAKGCCESRVYLGGNWNESGCVYRRAFGERSPWCRRARKVPERPGAVSGAADALAPDDAGYRGVASVKASRCHAQVDRVQARGHDLENRLALPGDRLGKVLDHGCSTVFVKYSSKHGSLQIVNAL